MASAELARGDLGRPARRRGCVRRAAGMELRSRRRRARAHLDLPGRGHVDDERGLEWSRAACRRRAPPAGAAHRAPRRAQPGVEAGVGDQAMGPAVVRVAVGGRRREDQLRARAAQEVDQRVLLLAAGAQRAVAAVEEVELAPRRGPRPRASASRRRSAGVPRVPASPRVRWTMPTRRPARGELGERAAAAELDVVGMGPMASTSTVIAAAPCACPRRRIASTGRAPRRGANAAPADERAWRGREPQAAARPPDDGDRAEAGRARIRAPAATVAGPARESRCAGNQGAAVEEPADVRPAPRRRRAPARLRGRSPSSALAEEQRDDRAHARPANWTDGVAAAALRAAVRRTCARRSACTGGCSNGTSAGRQPGPLRKMSTLSRQPPRRVAPPRRARRSTARSPRADSSWRAAG